MDKRFIILPLLFLTCLLVGYGFAKKTEPLASNNLNQTAFKKALPGYRFQFPIDHRAHKEYKTEWWYYTGHLSAENGKDYGYELTFFRTALFPESSLDNKKNSDYSRWQLNQIYPAHFAITDLNEKKFYHTELLNRQGLGIANASTENHDIRNQNWQSTLIQTEEGYGFNIKASHPDFAVDLNLTPQKRPIVHGFNGVSQKSSCTGCASHYYSMTRLSTNGTLRIKNTTQNVQGLTWMDQEFGSNQLAENQTGWDWFSIQLDNNTELMLYLLRLDDGRIDSNSSGTLITASGQKIHLPLTAFKISTTDKTWTSTQTNATYPQEWEIQIPEKNIALSLSSDLPEQELTTQLSTGTAYWEGSVTVSGSMNNNKVSGKGYVEMTGYAEKFKQKI